MYKRETQALRYAIAAMWLISALLPIIPSVQERAMSELARFDLPDVWLLPLMYGAMATDLAFAILSLTVARPWVWFLQQGLVMAYTALLTFSHSSLWLDPFGSLMKNIPIMAALWLLVRVDSVNLLNEKSV